MTDRIIRSLYGSELGRAYQLTRSPEAEPYWAACREHRLVLPRCVGCGRFHFYPRPFCPHCDAGDIEWPQVSGEGVVYTFAVVRQPIENAFAALLPYVIAVIELNEGVRILSHITDVAPESIACDMRVCVDFKEISPSLVIPTFRPDPQPVEPA